MDKLETRYVWGEYFSPNGQYVKQMEGVRVVAVYKAWHGKVEARSITLYPYNAGFYGFVRDFTKKTVMTRDIHNK